MNTSVVCRSYKSPRMKASGFYYYHADCWDAREVRGSDEVPSAELSTEQLPIKDGSLRLVLLSDIALNATCCECSRTLHNADEILAGIQAFKQDGMYEGWVRLEGEQALAKARTDNLYQRLTGGETLHVLARRTGKQFSIQPVNWEGALFGYSVLVDGQVQPGYDGLLLDTDTVKDWLNQVEEVVNIAHSVPFVYD